MTLPSDCFSGSMERSGGIREFSPNAALFRSEVGSMGKRKPIIIGKKLRGEWAEMIFMLRATEHGLQVSKPWGDSRSYDFVVGRPRHFVAVQVKSTIFELEEGWMCTVLQQRQSVSARIIRLSGGLCCFRGCLVHHSRGRDSGNEVGLAAYEVQPFEVRKVQRSMGVAGSAICNANPVTGHIDDIQGCAEEFSSDWIE